LHHRPTAHEPLLATQLRPWETLAQARNQGPGVLNIQPSPFKTVFLLPEKSMVAANFRLTFTIWKDRMPPKCSGNSRRSIHRSGHPPEGKLPDMGGQTPGHLDFRSLHLS
jgi:hypothetical protein